MKFLLKRSFWALLSVYVTLLLVIVMIAGNILNDYAMVINGALNIKDYEIITEVKEGEDLEYFKSNYVKKDENGNPILVTDENGYVHQVYDDVALREDVVEKALQVQREGTTILWNSDDNGLPLAEGNKVSLFSRSSVSWGYSGGGSGKATAGDDMKTAFTKAGLEVNNTLWNFYSKGPGSDYVRVGMTKMNEVPWSVYTDDVKNSFASYGDAAVVVLTRLTREGSSGGAQSDVSQTGADTPTGDYLDLSEEEDRLIDELIALKKAGVFKKVVVLINTPAGIYMDSLVARRDDIDCCMWVCQTGTVGLNEIGNILAGKSIPSGHLADTFAYNTTSAPAYVNSIASMYTNAESMGLSNIDRQGVYLAYAEGIYVGYKYYETRYEDTVLGRGNASSTVGTANSKDGWVYSEEVAFPFGYGDSYTSFEYSGYNVTENEDGDYVVTLTVKNVGREKGADAVQVYVQKPYTAYDIMWGIEQASVNLAGFAKTKMLDPGESVDVEIVVRADAFKTYDAYNKKTYIREKGDYYITAAQDAHEAINNILAAKGYTPENTDGRMDAAGKADFVKEHKFTEDDFETFSKSDKTGNEITNRFDDVSWNLYENKSTENITYLSRNDWQGTYPTETVKLSLTDKMVEEIFVSLEAAQNPDDEMPKYGQSHQLSLIDLKGLPFDSEYWDILLDQLTYDEQITLLGRAQYALLALDSIASPGVKCSDGPLGVKSKYMDSKVSTMSYPSPTLLAASYNEQLAKEVGEMMGEEALHSGITGIYAPGANTHRTAYSARNWEYLSEDGFLAGIIAKNEVAGIQSKGCYVNMKHFALNDQESYRHGGAVWCNEQALREIYLAAYEYAVVEADAHGIMTAFNRFGTKWSGAHKGLCTDILRTEWGMEGFVLSDSPWIPEYMGILEGVMAGNDCILYQGDLSHYDQGRENPTVALAVRESVHRVLYVVANSHAMNGINSNTRIVKVETWWQELITDVQSVAKIATIALWLITLLAFIILRSDDSDFSGTLIGKIIATPITIILALAMIVGTVAVPIYLKNLPEDYIGNILVPAGGEAGSDDIEEEPSLKDQLEGDLVDYRFEAEISEMTSDKAGAGTFGLSQEEANYPSGGMFISSIKNATDYKSVFKITAEADGPAVLSLCMGLREWRMNLARVHTITVNGEPLEIDKSIEFPTYSTVKYYDWKELEVAIVDLKKGENTIVIEKKSGLGDDTGNGLNFDYLTLTSATKLEWTHEVGVGHSYEPWSIDTAPTVESAGEIVSICTTCRDYKRAVLPAISEANGYTKVSENVNGTYQKVTYSITVEGYTYTYNENVYPEGWTDYRFEAECSDITSDKATAGTYGLAQSEANYPSGGAFISAIKNSENYLSVFNVTSDSNASAVLSLCMGLRNDSEYVLSEAAIIKVNGEVVDTTGIVFPKGSGINHYNWTVIEIAGINLKSGNNVITVEKVAGLGNKVGTGLNFDYMSIGSTTKLQWTSEVGVGHTYKEWYVITAPTLTEAGLAESYCSTCRNRVEETLPAISIENGYVLAEVEDTAYGAATWTLIKGDTTLTFVTRNYPENAEKYIFEAEESDYSEAKRYNSSTSGASNKSCLYNMSGKTWNTTFNITSDKAGKALLVMRVSCDMEINLADGRTLMVNGKVINLAELGVTFEKRSDSWKEYDVVVIDLNEGRNVITLSSNGTKFIKYFDYIALYSESALSAYTGNSEHTCNPVSGERMDPTCNEAGFEPASYCSICNKLISKAQELEALGHIDENGDGICDRGDHDYLEKKLYSFTVLNDKDPFSEENGGSFTLHEDYSSVTGWDSTYQCYNNTYGASFKFSLCVEESTTVDLYFVINNPKADTSVFKTFTSVSLDGTDITSTALVDSSMPKTNSWKESDQQSVLIATITLHSGVNEITVVRSIESKDSQNYNNVNVRGIEVASPLPVKLDSDEVVTYTFMSNVEGTDPFDEANGGSFALHEDYSSVTGWDSTYQCYNNTYGASFKFSLCVEESTTVDLYFVINNPKADTSVFKTFTSVSLDGTDITSTALVDSSMPKTNSWKESDQQSVLIATITLHSGVNEITVVRSIESKDSQNYNNVNVRGIEVVSSVPVELGSGE